MIFNPAGRLLTHNFTYIDMAPEDAVRCSFALFLHVRIPGFICNASGEQDDLHFCTFHQNPGTPEICSVQGKQRINPHP